MSTSISPEHMPVEGPRRRKTPLFVKILICVALGVLVGLIFRDQAGVLERPGMLVIRLLKALATPLIFVAILDAFLRTKIPAGKGLRLIVIAGVNALVAIAIALTLVNLLQPGKHWQGKTDEILAGAKQSQTPPAPAHASLSPLDTISGFVPESLIKPFEGNAIITIVLLAVVFGVALRRLKDSGEDELVAAIAQIEKGIYGALRAFTLVLEWIIQLIPIAVFCIVGSVVGRAGIEVFGILGIFMGTILLGLFLHAVVYYGLLLKFVAKVSPVHFFREGAEAIVTALSCGSSLATLPVTLRTLTDKMKVSPSSTRLAACVGTNLNHAGIILYEAMAALFMAQAFGLDVPLSAQVTIAVTSLMAGIGIAGVAEAGLVTLPLVLGAVGLPTAVTSVVIPLVLPVDWIIGRGRAATNVISDMTVANVLDRLSPEDPDTPDHAVVEIPTPARAV